VFDKIREIYKLLVKTCFMKKEKLVEKGYDKIADTYHSNRDKFKSQTELEKFIKLLRPNSKVLDVGCGAGIPVTRFLVDTGFEVTGIDISSKMIDLAMNHVPEASFFKQDMTSMTFSDGSFDGIVSFYSIFHVPREKHFFIFRNFFRILKKGGVTLFSLGSTSGEETADYFGADMFWSHYDPEESIKLVQKAGFDIIYDEILERGGEKHYWIIAKKRN